MKKIKILMICLLFTLGSVVVVADPPGGGGNGNGNGWGSSGNGNGNDVPRGAPIDGGMSILLGLGALYGARKIYKNKKESEKV